MAIPNPIPLFPTYTELKDMRLDEYPGVQQFLVYPGDGNKLSEDQIGLEKKRHLHWGWGVDFLKYTGRNKSEHTYTRFRNEVERFLVWCFLIKQKPLDELRKNDILDYADFCWQPPVSWISTANVDRFEYRNGFYHINKHWAPYRLKLDKNKDLSALDAKEIQREKKRYRPSQQTLTATFTALVAFYKYLMNEELCYGNPAQIAKKDCRYFIKDAQVKDVRRLSENQWQYALDTALELADLDRKYERSLFVIAALKTLFLRISELSERSNWSPSMNHFWEDEDGNWWLKVYGKGRKLRDTTVPSSFIPYLKRYREYRGLSPLPSPTDHSCVVEKIRGQGGMTARHLTRLVQEVFDSAYKKMKKDHGEDRARKLQEASTHWLRHTGASMEIERGRALKDLSEDLGHASMATTDSIYVQTENKKRAASGKARKVD